MTPVKVEVRHLTKRFKMYRRASHRLAEWLSFGLVQRHRVFTALDDISFTMRQGEFFGVIGPNGSGKSTLLKILTQVMWPTSGSVRIDGRVTSLLELGTGFNPELTGRENIVTSARLLGFSEDFIRRRIDEMIAFADISAYIEQPIKYYSSGMLVRLAFSIFSHVEPDIFIVDEALSVGDIYFAQKCFQRLDQMRANGCTLLFVSHDLSAVRRYCDQVLYLHRGRCRFLGPALEATDLYLESMSPGGVARGLVPETDGSARPAADAAAVSEEIAALRATLAEPIQHFDEESFRRVLEFAGARIGTGAARIAAVRTCDERGQPRERFGLNETVHIHVLTRVHEDVERGTMGVQLTNRMGIPVWGTNHERLSGRPTRLERGTWSYIHFRLSPGLGPGEYTLDVGYGDASGEGHVFDRLTGILRLEIAPEGPADFVGLARIPCVSETFAFEPVGAANLV